MDEHLQAVIREQLEERNFDMGGEVYSALVELGPGRWYVRTLTQEGQLDEEPVDDYLRERQEAEAVDEADEIRDIELEEQAEADPHDEEAAAEAALDKHWEQRNADDDKDWADEPVN